MVEHAVTKAASLMSKGRSYIAFPYSGTSCNKDVFLFINKSAFRKTHHHISVYVPVGIIVELLNGSLVAEAGVSELSFHSAVLSVIPFRFYETGNELIGSIIFLPSR